MGGILAEAVDGPQREVSAAPLVAVLWRPGPLQRGRSGNPSGVLAEKGSPEQDCELLSAWRKHVLVTGGKTWQQS